MKKLVVAIVVLSAVAGGGYWYYRYSNKPAAPTVTTAPVTRGDIVESVGATGTLQAVTTVQVGSQVSGNISFLGADFNSLVKKGQVLARLDPSLFDAQIQQSQANLAQARANLTKSQSDLERSKVQLTDAEQKYTRAKELSARSLLPQSDLDSAKIAVDTAQAALQSQQSTVIQTQAAIAQSQAQVNQNQVNLDHTVITAPIDGLVISRNVDVGQTVAASMQAPTLFVLAADLTKMQVLANLDESDVGRIRPSQAVTFRVDAYPNETFHGTVSQVRLQPVVQQNVVTYATVINVPNDDLRLKPGMTANVNVEISRANNVLRVPNGALRFRPTNEMYAALGQTPPEPQGRGFGGGSGGGRRGGGQLPDAGSAPPPSSATGSVAPPASGAQPGDARQPASGSGGRGGAPADAAPGAAASNGGARGGEGSSPSADSGAASAAAGRGGRRAGGDANGGGAQSEADRQAGFAERMQNMTPDQREAMTARMRERGIDPNAPGGRGGAPGTGRAAASGTQAAASSGAARRGGAAAAARAPAGASTIDALFAPLPRTETVGRAFVYADKQLKPVRLRLGITDGQNTELVGGDLPEGSAVVTNVVIPGQASTRPAATPFPGFGPQRGGFGGPGGGGGRGR